MGKPPPLIKRCCTSSLRETSLSLVLMLLRLYAPNHMPCPAPFPPLIQYILSHLNSFRRGKKKDYTLGGLVGRSCVLLPNIPIKTVISPPANPPPKKP